MAKQNGIVTLVAPAIALFWIGTFPSLLQRHTIQMPDASDQACSIFAPHTLSSDVFRQHNAARPYSPCPPPKRPRARYASKSPEPMIRVEPIYPEKAREAGIGALFVANLSTNELGEVVNAKVVGRCHPKSPCPHEFEEAVLAAVRLWRYMPVFEDGDAITQNVSATVIFEPRIRRSGDGLHVKIDPKGELREVDGTPIGLDALKASNSIIVTCEPSVSFAVLESTLNNLKNQGINNIHLSSWNYAFEAGQLFYRFLCGAEMGSGATEEIQPPSIEIDVDHLAALAKASGPSTYLPSSSNGGGLLVPVTYLSYVIYVSQQGEIIAVERTGGPFIMNVGEELRHAHVLQPGQRGTSPVPATVSVFIPIK